MKLNEAKEWVKSVIEPNNGKDNDIFADFDEETINNATGYAELLYYIDMNFYISENDANAIIEFIHNKGIKLYRNPNDTNTTSPL